MKQKVVEIGVVTHNFPSNPKERKDAGIFVYDFTSELAKYIKVNIFCLGGDTHVNRVGNVNTTFITWLGKKKLGYFSFYNPVDYFNYVFSFLNGFVKAEKFIKTNRNIKTTLAMWAFPAGLFTLWLRIRFGLPYSVWVLGSDIYVYGKFPIVRQVIALILKQAEYVFADGIDLKQRTEELANREVIFLPSASKMPSSEINKKKTFKKKIVLTFLGRMERVKGPDVFLAAILKIKTQLYRFKINFIGDGSLLNSLKEEARKQKITAFVDFYGNISEPKKISDILSEAHMLVIPSRSDSIPLVFSEAMKSGTPIIASDLPDLSYLVRKYKVGYTFKKEDSSDLAKIIVELLESKEKIQEFSSNTKEAARDFSVEGSVDKFLTLTRKI